MFHFLWVKRRSVEFWWRLHHFLPPKVNICGSEHRKNLKIVGMLLSTSYNILPNFKQNY